jgi:tetratricopeptide (TPR) repeat protein
LPQYRELDRRGSASASAATPDTEPTRSEKWFGAVIESAKSVSLRAQARRQSALALLLGILSLHNNALAAAPAMQIGRLVELIDTDEHEDHFDILIQFSCSVRYIANTPNNHGSSTSITLQLGPDCGSLLGDFPPELPLVGGGGSLVTGAHVDSIVPGQAVLELTWSKDLSFVMAPTVSGRGLHVRLLGTSRKKATIHLGEVEAPEGYAVNLDSSSTNFSIAAVQAAAANLKTQAYISETDIEDTHWYRLRVGPFTTRQEAERVLQIAQATYPRAWLAVNDEQIDLSAVEHAGARSDLANRPTDPPLPDEKRAQMLLDARVAIEKHQYPQAIDLLNILLRQAEYPARADAQELLGLVRERSGQLALAKAEYEDYLRRYPDRPGAARVRGRLQALAAASIAPKPTGEFGAAASDRWTMAGSAALTYQYGTNQIVTSGTSTTTTAVNAALVYGDLFVRDRGQRYDFTARVDAGYTQNILTTAGGSQDRTTAAFVELTDKNWGLTGRLGRQSLASLGVIGIFDGLFVGYQINPHWSVSAAGGYPAYTSYSAFSTQSTFSTVTAEYSPRQSLVFDTYLFDQTDSGFTDRRSVGFQTRFSQPGRTGVMLIDYDFYFRELNSATLIGNLRVGQSWVLGFDADYRRSPLLLLTNALIGQSAPDLTVLATEFTTTQMKQLALDRTSISDTFVLSATRPLGERWQLLLDAAALRLSGTPASGGVPATVSTGLDKNFTAQISGSSLLQAGDLHIFGVHYDDSPIAYSETLSWDARFRLPGAWRFGPRFGVALIDNPTLGGKQTLFLPEVRGDWTSRTAVFEAIAGYQIQNQLALQQQGQVPGQILAGATNQRSLYISVAYRQRF